MSAAARKGISNSTPMRNLTARATSNLLPKHQDQTKTSLACAVLELTTRNAGQFAEIMEKHRAPSAPTARMFTGCNRSASNHARPNVSARATIIPPPAHAAAPIIKIMNFKKFRFLLATLALLALVIIPACLGIITATQGGAMLLLGQLAIASRSRMRPALFLAGFTPEQMEEWEKIMGSMALHADDIKAIPGLSKGLKKLEGFYDTIKSEVSQIRRSAIRGGSGGGVQFNGGQMVVSEDCARLLGGLAFCQGVQRGLITGSAADTAQGIVKEFLGAEFKAALTSSDIPLPTEYSGQVVELVGLYGSARKYGTVFPLGGATVKLPQLATDTTFGLIAGSGTVTEKSPQTAWVTFTPEKFGGLVRLPSELVEDSIVPIGQFIARYAARNIARAEDTNFFVGSGADSGINGAVAGLTYSTITNSKVVQMASTKTHYSDATLANFQALRAVPDASAIRNGAYYLHPSFEQLLASFNTGGNRPYNPTAQLQNPNAAQPFIVGPTLDGFPVRWVDVMPAYSTSANVSKVFALFGDASFQYLGVRGGVRFDTSMEAGFTTDEILIRALERFTIGLMANGAMGGLETAAS